MEDPVMKKLLSARRVWVAAVLGLAGLLAGCESSTSTDGVDSFFDENRVVIEPAPVNPRAPIRDSSFPINPDPGDPEVQMSLSPETATLETDGDVTLIQVDGGKPPYTWAVNDVSKGSVTSTGSASAAYQRSDSGDNVVICTDSQGQTVLAVMGQP